MEKRQEMEEFEKIVKPLIKYMAENHHPHTMLIIDSTHAEIVEGVISTYIDEYLID